MKTQKREKSFSDQIFVAVRLIILVLAVTVILGGCVSHVAWTAGGGREGIEEAGQMVTRRGPGVDYPHRSKDLQLDQKVKVGQRSAQQN